MFIFSSVADIGNNPLSRERITDFTTGDRIDLTAIDANTVTAGFQTFNAIGASFTGTGPAASAANAGKLRYVDGILSGDTNGDGVADFQIGINPQTIPGAGAPVPSLSLADFILGPITASIASNTGAGITELNVGTSLHSFTVSLDRAAATAITLNWAVSSAGLANAANAADFGAAFPTGTVTIAAGQTTGAISVSALGDTAFEQNENFRVTITANTPTAALYQIGTAAATSIILNDDATPINGTNANNTLTGTCPLHTSDAADDKDV